MAIASTHPDIRELILCVAAKGPSFVGEDSLVNRAFEIVAASADLSAAVSKETLVRRMRDEKPAVRAAAARLMLQRNPSEAFVQLLTYTGPRGIMGGSEGTEKPGFCWEAYEVIRDLRSGPSAEDVLRLRFGDCLDAGREAECAIARGLCVLALGGRSADSVACVQAALASDMPHVFREALRYVNVFDAAIVCRMLLPGIAELVSGKDGSDVLSLVIEGGVAGELAVTHMLATCDRATRARVLAYAQEHPRHAARLRYGLVYASTEDEDEVLRSAAHEIRRSLDDE